MLIKHILFLFVIYDFFISFSVELELILVGGLGGGGMSVFFSRGNLHFNQSFRIWNWETSNSNNDSNNTAFSYSEALCGLDYNCISILRLWNLNCIRTYILRIKSFSYLLCICNMNSWAWGQLFTEDTVLTA